jgi:hypothetical protein
VKYFSYFIPSSTSASTLSITPLNSGLVEIYVQVYNSSVFNSAGGGDSYILPNPMDSSTFSYSTLHSEDNHVYIPALNIEDELIAIAAVKAKTDVRFTIISTSSQSAAILQSGTATILNYLLNLPFKI